MYNAVDQLVLLYGSESWVVTGAMLKVLEGFQKPGSPADHWYECDIWGRQGVEISSSGSFTGSRESTPHNGVH